MPKSAAKNHYAVQAFAAIEQVTRALLDAGFTAQDVLGALHAQSCTILTDRYGVAAPARYFGVIAKECLDQAHHARLVDAARRTLAETGQTEGAA